MANRAMQAKALKLSKQRRSAPVMIDKRVIETCDPHTSSVRAATIQLAWGGDKLARTDKGATQRQLSCFKYDPDTFQREVRLIPAR
jgi:hypothetical protein